MARKKGGGHGGGGGGHDAAGGMRWLLTYADLVTLLMVFFIIIAVLSTPSRAKFMEFSKALQQTFGIMRGTQYPLQGAGGTSVILPKLDAMMKIREFVAKDLREIVNDNKVRVGLSRRGVKITFVDAMIFNPGSADITSEGQEMLDMVGLTLARITQESIEDTRLLAIEGHTDAAPINTAQFPSNWELSTARATNVLRYLVDNCSIPPNIVSATGYADQHPITIFPEENFKNRRIDIVIERRTISDLLSTLGSVR